jgi:uncharacterized membrane protein YqjE
VESNLGTFAALKRAASTLLAMAQTRFELAGLELVEEKNRLLVNVLSGFAGVLFLCFAAFFLSLAVVAHFWETYRVLALLSIGFAYLALGGLFMLSLKKQLRHAPPPFQATISELNKDRETILNTFNHHPGGQA